MIIDRSHRVWFMTSLLALLLAGVLYIPYALWNVTGTGGGSTVGLIYGSIGSAMMLFAGLLGARKKFPTWRVGRATFWMRAHLWIGFLSFPFIVFHAGFRLGSGALTQILMALFLVVFVSGIFGAVLQHYMPQVMTQRVPMETIYEQIDRVLEQLLQEAGLIVAEISEALEQEMIRAEEAEKLAPVAGTRRKAAATVAAADERTSRKVTSFFESQLKPFLMSRSIQKQALANPAQAAPLFQQLRVLVPQSLWPKFEDLENICEEKRQLERERRLHHFLHGWLLIHIPASYALLLLSAIHAVVALRF
ncbi:MAG TPA: hypothetical protein VN868_10645 [Terriglobales bacterium]|nr:hypothetical protein [Terriglobales bacterium]